MVTLLQPSGHHLAMVAHRCTADAAENHPHILAGKHLVKASGEYLHTAVDAKVVGVRALRQHTHTHRTLLVKQNVLRFGAAAVHADVQFIARAGQQRINRYAEKGRKIDAVFKIRQALSPLPCADRLEADKQPVRQRFLGQALLFPVIPDGSAYLTHIGHMIHLCIHYKPLIDDCKSISLESIRISITD